MAKHRLQFDFTEEALNQLNELREAAGLPNRAEVIRHALRLLHWLLEEVQGNKAKLFIEKNGKCYEVAFPFWKTDDEKIAEKEQTAGDYEPWPDGRTDV
ncbi:ribbon-helix-helix domain-containing protein [Patescibacteria group bacterium]|nr:ribbon-helix-helix domain-containing protein [Patescibacteria group bacterium]